MLSTSRLPIQKGVRLRGEAFSEKTVPGASERKKSLPPERRRQDCSMAFRFAGGDSVEASMGKEVFIEEEECIGCGTCEEMCEEVFRLNEETEKAEVIMPEGGPEDLIQEVIDSCPVECIHWEE
jgi:ferredoxin